MNTGWWDIGFVHQPASSPDCNTLDLTFFRAIQSLQYQKCAKNVDELVAHVQEAFAKLPLDVCRKVWSTAQIVMNQILLHNGNNDYKLPHVGKLKTETLAGRDISLRLPCRALIDGGALDCEYIISFMSNDKLIVHDHRRRPLSPVSSVAPLHCCHCCRCHDHWHCHPQLCRIDIVVHDYVVVRHAIAIVAVTVVVTVIVGDRYARCTVQGDIVVVCCLVTAPGVVVASFCTFSPFIV
jgi:hypothetical protein